MLEPVDCPGRLSETGDARAAKKGPETTPGLRLGLKYAKRSRFPTLVCPDVVARGLGRLFLFFPLLQPEIRADGGAPSPAATPRLAFHIHHRQRTPRPRLAQSRPFPGPGGELWRSLCADSGAQWTHPPHPTPRSIGREQAAPSSVHRR